MKKKIIITIGCIAVAALALFAWFKSRLDRMYESFQAEVVTDIDLSRIQDGIYIGEAGDFVVSVKLSVTVDNGEITDIQILEQKGGRGYEAHEILPRMIQAQSPDVEIVTGATGSSRCIMIAVRNALIGDSPGE